MDIQPDNQPDNQPSNEPFDYSYEGSESIADMPDKSRIVYQIQESRSGSVYEAFCAELVITGFGDTAEAAKEELRSQVAMYLEDCDNLGELDDVLIEAGFYYDGDKWVSNEVAPVNDPKINFFGKPGEITGEIPGEIPSEKPGESAQGNC